MSWALPEFWKLWGMLGGSVVAGLACLALAWFSPTDSMRRMAITAGLCCFAFSFVFGLGAGSRDSLCRAQIAQMQENFLKFEAEVNNRIDVYSAVLNTELEKKDAEHAAKVAEMAGRLKGDACMPTPARLDELRNLRTVPGNGKR